MGEGRALERLARVGDPGQPAAQGAVGGTVGGQPGVEPAVTARRGRAEATAAGAPLPRPERVGQGVGGG